MKTIFFLLIIFLVLGINSYPKENILSSGLISLEIKNDLTTDIFINKGSSRSILASAEKLFKVRIGQNLLNFPPENTQISSDENSVTIVSNDGENDLRAQLIIKTVPEFNDLFVCIFDLENISGDIITISEIVFGDFILDAKNAGADSSYKYWTFQGASYISRPDWILKLNSDYDRENFMGNNSPDYGGGIPVVDFWTKQSGIAFASVSQVQRLLYMPVRVNAEGKVDFSISERKKITLAPKEKFSSVPFAVIAHEGDYYNPLKKYSALMQTKNIRAAERVQPALEAEWCAWGYGRTFVPSQIFKSLPKVKELNFKWATFDDGWQDADGDWGLVHSKFPNGDQDMKAVVDSIHNYGLKARLWWVPYSANDSSYNVRNYPNRMNEFGMKVQSKLALEHPDWFILDEQGKRYQIEWWNSYLICPALPEVRQHYVEFISKALKVWGYDGFKIDGQNINTVPPCYNPKHNHKNPEESFLAVPEYFKTIYNATYSINKDAVIQVCPCGSNFSFYNIPYTTQFVSSDPSSSWQVRHRIKTFKAVAEQTPVAGDHVELTNRAWDPELQKSVPYKEEDFASTVGVGGVVASKFSMPGIEQADSSVMLTPDKEAKWKKWVEIYNQEKLSAGSYLNLYDIAYDKPETHVIAKDEAIYYSMFSDELFSGNIKLRGLKDGNYMITDYYNNKDLGEVNSQSPELRVNFKDFLFIKATVKEIERLKN